MAYLMKLLKETWWIFASIAALGALVFFVTRSERPDPIVIDLRETTTKSAEHELVSQTLKDPETFAANEEQALAAALQPDAATPTPTPGAPLPVAWERKPAPNIDEVELSPALQRSLAASAHLRTDAYINPKSSLNLQSVASLREIREQRQSE
jgi:hypothetical protein